MNILYKCLTYLAFAALLIAVTIGLVAMVDQLDTFHNETWALPIVLLLVMATVPIVLYFAIVDEVKVESDESREEEAENNITDRLE